MVLSTVHPAGLRARVIDGYSSFAEKSAMCYPLVCPFSGPVLSSPTLIYLQHRAVCLPACAHCSPDKLLLYRGGYYCSRMTGPLCPSFLLLCVCPAAFPFQVQNQIYLLDFQKLEGDPFGFMSLCSQVLCGNVLLGFGIRGMLLCKVVLCCLSSV